MATLEEAIVSIKIKGQEAVLSGMNKIKKEGEKLTKAKNIISPSPATPKAEAATKKETPELEKQFKEKKTPELENQFKEKEDTDKKNGNSFKEAANKFKDSVKTFTNSAASLDPTATMKSVTSALGTSLSGISVLGVSLGRLPEGIAELTNTALTMSKNSIDMAKQSTAAYHQLADRNAMTSYYKGEVNTPEHYSRNEMAGLIATISGSMGKIQTPLAAELNKLTGTKDTAALARVGAGNWESTGTDKGWMIQQVMNGMQGMPPSMKQKIQASMLKSYSGEIQDYTGGQKEVQRQAAGYENQEEDKTKNLYQQANYNDVYSASEKLNKLQSNLFDAGMHMTGAINKAADAAAALPQTLENMRRAMEEFTKNANRSNLSKMTDNVMRVFK